MPSKQIIPHDLRRAGLGVDVSDNRTNSGGASLGSVKHRTSLIYNNVIPAGQTLPVPASGTQFYVIVCTAAIAIKPSGGVFNSYAQGKGLQLDEVNAFNLLQVRNDNAFPVAFSIFVGFDAYIDKTFILNQTGQATVAYPTYPTANSSIQVLIPDLSGQAFSDINGNQFYALSREAIYIFNPDPGVTLLLQKANSNISNGPAVGIVYPVSSLRYAASGDFSLSVGGGNINCIVSELYEAIPKLI